MAWFVRVYVHQSAKLKMAETEMTEMFPRNIFLISLYLPEVIFKGSSFLTNFLVN